MLRIPAVPGPPRFPSAFPAVAARLSPSILSALIMSALVLSALLSAPHPALAQTGPPLFQDYQYGAPRTELAGQPGMFDCSQDLGPGALCLSGVEYLERTWEADFAFVDGRLRSVSLVAPFDKQLYTLAFAEVVKESALVAMQSLAGEMDLTALLVQHQDNPEAFDQAVTGFESQGMAEGALAYIFLDKQSIAVSAAHAANLAELLEGAELDVLQTVLVLTSGEGRDWISLIFEYPNLEPNR